MLRDQEYAFELSSIPSPDGAQQTCGIAAGPVGDSYARGRGSFRDPINGSAYLPLPNGAPADEEDLPFRILAR